MREKNPSEEDLKKLLKYYQNKKYNEAKKLALKITKEFPENQFSWKVLAAVLKISGKISDSLIAGQKT